MERKPMHKNPQGENDFHPVRFMEAGIRAADGEENERQFELLFVGGAIPGGTGWRFWITRRECMELSRLQSIGVVLFNHRTDRVIGKIVKAWNEAGRGKALIEFDDDEESEVIRKKVAGGTLKGVSVGYSVDAWEEVAAGKKSSDGRFTGPCYIAKKWTPLEVSVVSVPADPTVGVGRGYDGPEIQTAEQPVDLGLLERMVQTNENLMRIQRIEV